MMPVPRRSLLLGAGATSALAATAAISSGRSRSRGPTAALESVQADPIAYLNNVSVLSVFPIRTDNTRTWVQSVSINEADGHVYVANQINEDPHLRIDVRKIDGSYVSSRTLPIAVGAWNEALPWFHNDDDELCFVVRTEPAESYAIFNYTTNTVGPVVAINGRAKSGVDGDYFITSDVWQSAISRFHIYDWESVTQGDPELLHTIPVARSQELFEKSQGLVLNGGYIFVIQGESEGNPGVTAYNIGGELVNAVQFDKVHFAEVLNSYRPGLIANPTNYHYENESGCTYQGKLVTCSIVWDGDDTFQAKVVLVAHNEIGGSRLRSAVPALILGRGDQPEDTGWQEIELAEGIVAYAGDTTPRWRRIGNHVQIHGAVKGIAGAPATTRISTLPPLARTDRSTQWTMPTSNGWQCNWQVSADGALYVLNTQHPQPGVSSWYPFSHSWIAG